MYWHAVAESEEVGNHLLACEADKLRLVVFRSQSGQPVALDDECWHKMLPLSNGRLKNDEIECAYHGLIFNAEGKCVRARLGPAPANACVRTYSTAEASGLVWVSLPLADVVAQDGPLDVGAKRTSLPS